MATIYDITVQDAKGNEVSLSDYNGKLLLIVNTATKCGFTPQYDGLQKLYAQFGEAGLEILDFPCDQFAHQAPGTDEEIGSFCVMRYGTTFPRFKKIDVNGKDESPLYTWLKGQKGGVLNDNIKWNFTKFLINRDGEVIGRFSPTKTPAALEKEIAEAIGVSQ
jgi:glutathione peroxidase